MSNKCRGKTKSIKAHLLRKQVEPKMCSRFVCVAFALFALINVIVGEIHTECPSDSRWIKHGNKCYFMERTNRNFERAKQRCEEMDATMLTIESKEENEFIEQTFTRITGYLGATRVPGTDKWRWPDGRFVEWFNWNENEPNNWRGNENCIQFYNNIGYPGKWNDY
ncbi:ladderlectin-like protein, partial [Leptotrombidium deliense]